MSKYNPVKHRTWYLKNRDRLLEVRRAYNKKRSESTEGRELDKIRNSSPERKSYRKRYKKTPAGRTSNNKYRSKPEVKEKYENYRLKARYGITLSEYWSLVAEQNGVCAICRLPDGKKLHVDHNHDTGAIRGLLCGSCNRGIGLFKDSQKLLSEAISYLDR